MLQALSLETTTDVPNVRVLTDFVSTHNTVVIEMEVENLGQYEKEIEKRQEYREKFLAAGYTDLFYTGRREILEVTNP